MSEAQKYKTFAITFRPRDGVTNDQIAKMEKWLRRHAEYHHLITEKEDLERHIHCGFVKKNESTVSNMRALMKGLFKGISAEESRVLSAGVKIMYNEDWLSSYLNKGDDTVVISTNLPEAGHLESYFPPKPIVSDNRTRKCSAYYHDLEKLWYEHQGPDVVYNTENARNFLFNLMYNLRCIPVIRDDQQIKQTARHLTRWMKKLDSSTIELAPFEHEE